MRTVRSTFAGKRIAYPGMVAGLAGGDWDVIRAIIEEERGGEMKPCIRFIKEWSDEHVVELRVEICDGTSLFVNRVYAGHDQLSDAVAGLRGFQSRIRGGTFDLRFGEFGPEYASGAFAVHLQFRKHGKILVRVRAQSEFDHFEDEALASEATLNLMSEPGLLDEFVLSLRAMSDGTSAQAELEAIRWN